MPLKRCGVGMPVWMGRIFLMALPALRIIQRSTNTSYRVFVSLDKKRMEQNMYFLFSAHCC